MKKPWSTTVVRTIFKNLNKKRLDILNPSLLLLVFTKELERNEKNDTSGSKGGV